MMKRRGAHGFRRLVTGFQQREERIGERLGGTRGDQHFALPVDIDIEEALGIFRNRLTQSRQAHHRRILVRPVLQRLDRGIDQNGRLHAFWKPLAEIDRSCLGG